MNSCAFYETCDTMLQKLKDNGFEDASYEFVIGDEDGDAYTLDITFGDLLLPG